MRWDQELGNDFGRGIHWEKLSELVTEVCLASRQDFAQYAVSQLLAAAAAVFLDGRLPIDERRKVWDALTATVFTAAENAAQAGRVSSPPAGVPS